MRNVKSTKSSTSHTGLSVIIPVAGCGSKTKSFGNKSLLEIQNRSLLEHQLSNIYASYPNAEVILVLGYEAERIYKRIYTQYPVKFVYNSTYDTSGQAYSIILGVLAASFSDILLIYGDIYFNQYTINELYNKEASVLVIDQKNQIIETKVGVAIDSNNLVTNVSHGLPIKWAQIALFTQKETTLLKKLFVHNEIERWLGYEIINYLLRNQGHITTTEHAKQKLLEINSIKDIQ